MISFLLLGFLVGMAHALEADHLSAVGTLALKSKGNWKRLVFQGAAWGMGHSITLFFISVTAILLGVTLTDRLAATLEFCVGIMLIVLGLDVIRRMRKNQVHFHVHRHGAGKPHLHVHSHKEHETHDHVHLETFPLRALLVGLVHGMAGSSGLLALAIAAAQKPALAIGYVVVFALGSIFGMMALSFVVSWPLGIIQKRTKLISFGLSLGVAGLAVYLGILVMVETVPVAFGFL